MKTNGKGNDLARMEYFTLSELCRSSVAAKYDIDNTPGLKERESLVALVENVLDPLRRAYGKPIAINSGYRSVALNAKVGGVKNSQHLTGEAADITAGEATENGRLFRLIQELKLPFDQLINEKPDRAGNPTWIHVSYSPRHRRQILTIK